MKSQPIYKRDSKGKIRVWQYEIDGDKFRTIAGLIDGRAVVSAWTTCVPRSRDTGEEQAVFEAEAERKKKLEREYHSTIEEIDAPNFFKPMLAEKYDAVSFPVFSQPKLDGIRCIATKAGLFSRQGKRIVSVPHIEWELQRIFEQNPTMIFDGELYNHELKSNFEKIISVVRKQKVTEQDIAAAAELIQFHVYDLPSVKDKFSQRWEILRQYSGSFVKLVDTKQVFNQKDLDSLYAAYLEDGYEGQMVRYDNAYEQKRSKFLLKRKDFLDAEFQLVRIEEGQGNWSGYGKIAVLRLPDGREFGAGIKGTQEFCRRLLSESYKSATIRYFSMTNDGIPRFPIAVAFHDEERF